MMAMANDSDGNKGAPVSRTYRLPPLFPMSVVKQAFEGLMHPDTVVRKMRELDAIEAKGKENLVKPDVLQDNYPRIYRECCRILVERDEKGAA